MATVYDQINSNNRKAFFLIFTFLILVIFIGWIFSYAFHNVFILYFAVVFSTLTSLVSYYNSDKVILGISQAREIKKEDHQELYRIIENLAITAGMKTPKLYIINEAQPNAFATGRNEEHAVVAVTQGLLDKLNKRELTAVLAHELAHIKSNDILINSVVVILVGIIVLLSDFFFRFLYFGNSNNNKNPILIVFAIISMLLAPLAATIIKLAISRKQEYRADAKGVLFTRDKDALISALIKISSDKNELTKTNSAINHLYISSPIKKKTNFYSKLFMTHPPLEERIRALENT